MDQQNQNSNNNGQGQWNNQSNMNNNGNMPASSSKTLMGVLAYLGILVIIPFLMARDDEFVKFHIRQGLVVFSLEVIIWLLGTMLFSLWMILNILNLATLVLSIVGIINVIQNKEKELPLVGSFSHYFNKV